MYLLADSDWTWLLRPPTLWGVVSFAWVVVALVAIIGPQWRRVHRNSEAARLIRQMVDRGFSADEIERVLNAGMSQGDYSRSRRDWKRFIRKARDSAGPDS